MNESIPFSVRLRPGLNEQVAAIASALDRPKSRVIEQAVIDDVAVQTSVWSEPALRDPGR